MPFYQLDDGTDSELRVVQAGTAAFGLYARCGIWVARNLRDGFVPLEIATLYGTREWIERLIVTGLWLPVDGGFMDADYLDKHKNRTAEKIRAERKLKADRQARWLNGKRGNGGSSPARRAPRPSSGPSGDASQDASKDTAPPLPTPKGVGVVGPPVPPSAAAAAYGDRDPANAGSAAPDGTSGPTTQSENPSQPADQSRNRFAQAAREAIEANRGRPYSPPDFDEKG